MYAAIQRYSPETSVTSDLAPTGRQIAAALQHIAGFVAYVLLDADDGQLLAISLFEDQAGLAQAQRLLRRQAADEPNSFSTKLPLVSSGEVIVQRGL